MATQWDDRIKQLGGGILQSQAWADFQHSQGAKTHQLSDNNWACLLIERSQKKFKYLYAPYGPVMRSSEDSGALLAIKQLAIEQKVDFVRLEPVGRVEQFDLLSFGTRRSDAMTVNPTASQVIDLTKSEAELEQELHSGHRRYIRAASRKGIEITQTTDPVLVEDFLKMMHDTSTHDNFRAHPDDYYRAMARQLFPAGVAKLFFASHDGKLVAGVMVFDFGDTRAYAHAAAFQALNRPLRAGLYLAWQIILDAKQNGLKNFDFWGIAPNDDPAHPLAGVTRFKTSFGGQTVHYVGAWDLPINKTRYKLYNTLQKTRRKLRGR